MFIVVVVVVVIVYSFQLLEGVQVFGTVAVVLVSVAFFFFF